MDSEFEFIKGYINLYKINKSGEIFSCWYQRNMTHITNEDGYKFVNLKVDGKRHKCLIHRLIALQWIDNPDNLPEVDHIDRNRLNNSIDNLRWVNKITQNRNKANYKDNLTPEQLQARKDRTKER